MYIKRLELENFANIKSGLGFNRLVIDFTNQTNTVCVITGGNGKGKTSLLSYMTPFATLGNLDVRDGVRLIIPKENGFKRIVIVDDDGRVYDIKHYYIPTKDTFTVKSYMTVDGVEMNENGNVTSFKNLVSELLGIELDYLKLVRIGDNISNLIKSKSTERKTFMAKILDEVDIYLKQHKEISKKESEEKAVILHITDELSKTGITDLSEVERHLKSLEKEIISVTKRYEEVEAERTKVAYDIELIGFPRDGLYLIHELQSKLKKYDSILLGLDDKLKTATAMNTKIHELEKEKIYADASHESTIKMHDGLLDELDTLMTTIQSLEIAIEKEKNALNLDSMREYLIELRKKTNEMYRTAFDELKIDCSLEEYEEFVLFLKNTQVLLNTTYEFGKEPIREVLKGMKKNQDIPNLITSSLVLLESRERAERMSIIDRLISRYAVDYDCKEKKVCPYAMLQRELMEIRDAKPVNEVTKDAEFYQMMKLAYDNLSRIFDSFKDYKNIIQALPNEIQMMFTIEALFDNIGNGTTIFNDGIINKYLSLLTERDTYYKLSTELKKLEEDVKRLEEISKLEYFNSQLSDTLKKVETVKEKISEAKEKLAKEQEMIDVLSSSISLLQTQYEAVVEYEGKKQELSELEEKQRQNEIKQQQLRDITQVVLEYKNHVSQLTTEKYQLESNIRRYKDLTKEFTAHKEIFEDYTHLKYALSNSKGLPLVYIEMYLTDTREIANELLDIVYDGSLYLEEFDVTEDEFRIPYVKDGTTISDVSSASQGEQSFLNMAISSALRMQSMKNYNIALFDEVDGAFDDTNRQKFIPVLERQLELGSTKQAFLITHNQMFQKYPVDRIDLDDISNSTVEIYGE